MKKIEPLERLVDHYLLAQLHHHKILSLLILSNGVLRFSGDFQGSF